MIKRLEKARTDNWTKRKFFEGTSAKLGPSIDNFGHPVTGLKDSAEEKKFEKALGFESGTLAKSSKYWNDFVIVVDSEGVRLDEDEVEDQLKLKFLEAQSIVAKGSKELLINPKAEYVLFSEEEEKIAKNQTRRQKNQVLKMVASMEMEEMRGMVLMFGHNPSGMSDDAVEDFIYDRAEDDPKGFELIAKDPKRESKIFVHKLVKAGVVDIRGGAYLYGGETLAYGIEATALHLENKKNQELRIALEKQLLEK